MISCMNMITKGMRGYRNTMRGHRAVRRLDTWLSFEGLNHSCSWSKPSDYKEIALFRQ
jgi:hypothetical protein